MEQSAALSELSEALNAAQIRHQPLKQAPGFWLDDHRVSLLLDRGMSQGSTDLAHAKPQAAVLIVRGDEALRCLVDILKRQQLLWDCLCDAPAEGFANPRSKRLNAPAKPPTTNNRSRPTFPKSDGE